MEMNLIKTGIDSVEREKDRDHSIKSIRYSRPIYNYMDYKVYSKECQKEGFSLEFAVLVFDVVCCLTGSCTFDNAYLTNDR